jgi:uncharacterized protein (TIGR02246 family)
MTDNERQIRELVESWIAASKAGDVPSLLQLMTDDVIFMTPGRPPFGKAEFAADAESAKGMTVDPRAEIQELEIVGSRAFVRSRIEAVLTAPGDSPQRLSGYAMSVLRKETDGRWRIARDANLVAPERADDPKGE